MVFIRKRARFTEVGHSSASVLAERDWPLSLTVVGKDGKRELMSINLKLLRKKDVAWLLALPELKVEGRGLSQVAAYRPLNLLISSSRR